MTDQPPPQISFHPSARNSISGVVGFLAICGVGFYAGGFEVAHGDLQGGLILACIASGGPIVVFVMFLVNASLTVDGSWVIKRNWYGRIQRCPRRDLADIQWLGSRLRFLRTDGTVAFWLAQVWWSDEQIRQMKTAIGLSESRDRGVG